MESEIIQAAKIVADAIWNLQLTITGCTIVLAGILLSLKTGR